MKVFQTSSCQSYLIFIATAITIMQLIIIIVIIATNIIIAIAIAPTLQY